MQAQFPTNYDAVSNGENGLFEEPQDNIILTLSTAVDTSATTLTFAETEKVTALKIPSYLTFESEDAVTGEFEIVKAVAKPASGQVTVTRGALGTTPLAHIVGEKAVQDPVSEHFASLRAMLVAVEKFQGLVGSLASRPAAQGAGQAFIAVDTQEVYYSTAPGNWVLLNRKTHDQFEGLDDDDHYQLYQNQARKQAWHDGLEATEGTHLTDAEHHNHTGEAGKGNPIARFRQGTSAERPASPSLACELFFESDTGDLYFASAAGEWQKYSVMPVGTVILFDQTCPQGWTQYIPMNDRFPKGNPTGNYSDFSSGGSLSHVHGITTVIDHVHPIGAVTLSTSQNGLHNHYISGNPNVNNPASQYVEHVDGTSLRYILSRPAGNHTHTITVPAHTLEKASTDANYFETRGASNLPPFMYLRFCKKT